MTAPTIVVMVTPCSNELWRVKSMIKLVGVGHIYILPAAAADKPVVYVEVYQQLNRAVNQSVSVSHNFSIKNRKQAQTD